ncbi:MAG: prepilin peptidase [Kiritimatiellia bacterium]
MERHLMAIGSVFAFLLGTLIASFLNVVVYRVPRGESVVWPPSHCPKCQAPIRWYQNLPILSWLALRGKCAACKAPISPRYLLVETIGGLLFLAAFWRYGYFAPLAWVWISLMIVGSFIDYDLQLLPDFVTVGGMIFGVATSVVFWVIGAYTPYHFHNLLPEQDMFFITPFQSLLGLAFGFGLLWVVRWLGGVAFRREAMGMGDVLLMGAVGALFGPVAASLTLILSAVAGTVVGMGMILLKKTRLGGCTAIPYGPYICLGCLVWMFRGTELVSWYMNLLTCR